MQVSDRRVLSEGGSGGGSTGVIIGAVVAVLLVLVAVCIGFFILKNRKNCGSGCDDKDKNNPAKKTLMKAPTGVVTEATALDEDSASSTTS